MTDNSINTRLKNLLKETGLLKASVFDYDLSRISSIKSGGICRCFIKVDKREGLLNFLEKFISAGRLGIDLYPVGQATNILFNDGFLNLIILKLGEGFDYLDFKKNGQIQAGAALKLQKFVVETAKKGYDFSFLAGIPGTLGGAVAGNSGTSEKGINSMVKKIKYISVSGNMVNQEEMQVNDPDCSYRKFNLPGLCMVTDIVFECWPLTSVNPSSKLSANQLNGPGINKTAVIAKEIILNRVRENIKIKKSSQPLNTRNVGCIFKNPDSINTSAGRIIDSCGLKGFKYGEAEISAVHANFIINTSRASSKDIYILSEIIRETVKNKFNIELEYEIRLAGF